MLWIKEVEMVDAVDDLKSSCCVRGIQMAVFEVLDAKIASALNRVIHDAKVNMEGTEKPEKSTASFEEDRSLT